MYFSIGWTGTDKLHVCICISWSPAKCYYFSGMVKIAVIFLCVVHAQITDYGFTLLAPFVILE
jgi:hypothetical protein